MNIMVNADPFLFLSHSRIVSEVCEPGYPGSQSFAKAKRDICCSMVRYADQLIDVPILTRILGDPTRGVRLPEVFWFRFRVDHSGGFLRTEIYGCMTTLMQ